MDVQILMPSLAQVELYFSDQNILTNISKHLDISKNIIRVICEY